MLQDGLHPHRLLVSAAKLTSFPTTITNGLLNLKKKSRIQVDLRKKVSFGSFLRSLGLRLLQHSTSDSGLDVLRADWSRAGECVCGPGQRGGRRVEERVKVSGLKRRWCLRQRPLAGVKAGILVTQVIGGGIRSGNDSLDVSLIASKDVSRIGSKRIARPGGGG